MPWPSDRFISIEALTSAGAASLRALRTEVTKTAGEPVIPTPAPAPSGGSDKKRRKETLEGLAKAGQTVRSGMP